MIAVLFYVLVALLVDLDFCDSMLDRATRSKDGAIQLSVEASNPSSIKDYHKTRPVLSKISFRSTKKSQRHEILLHNINDMYYYAHLAVGNPPQMLRVMLDTGSSLLWLPSAQLRMQDPYYPSTHRVFYNYKSGTYELQSGMHNQNYGKGQISGVLVRDNIKLGSYEWKHQLFVEVLRMDSDTACKDYDGIFGLGKKYLDGANIEPPFLSMFQQGLVPTSVFSISLTKNGSKTAADIAFGGINKEKYTGEIIYAKTYRNLWYFAVNSLLINGQPLFDESYDAIPDSGSSMIYIPDYLIESIRKQCNASAHPTIQDTYLVNCSNLQELPKITFMVGNNSLDLSPSDYTMEVEDDDDGITKCMLLITADPNLDFYLLGNPFMRSYYTIFDHENSRIGFAKSRQ